jgi:hypothetical protein
MTKSLLVLAALASGCGPVLHREMLGESIRSFSARMKNGPEAKVWIAGPDDSSCDSGCFQGSCGGGKSKAMSLGLGGLFAPKPVNAPSPQDGLAYQVFANYLTQRKKARVLEPHRHNYATEGNVETHKKVEVTHEGQKTATTSCEDLCLLDEAKKRKADKVLAYYIGMITSEELIIHFRFSDVPTGLIEAAQTIRVKDLQAVDWSYGTGLGTSERRPARESGGGGGGD